MHEAPPTRVPRPVMILPLLALVAVLAVLALLLFGPSSKTALPGGARQGGPGDGYFGTLALPSKQAPQIALDNYLGQPVKLSQFRGKAVLLTFLYAHCPDVCPLIASNLRVALSMLGARAKEAQVIAVSVDPRGDTPAAVGAFVADHGMTGRMQYLIGSAAQLGRVWAQWSVGAESEVDQPDQVAHSALVYGISASGRITTIYPDSFAPSQIAHDVPLLAAH